MEKQSKEEIPPDPESLMNETAGGIFLGVTRRAMQQWRLKGTGPKYIRISSRCVRYRRRDLIAFADERLRSSTSDQGVPNAAL